MTRHSGSRLAVGTAAVALVVSVAACSGAPQFGSMAGGTHATIGPLSFQLPAMFARFTAPQQAKNVQGTATQNQTTIQGTTHSSSEGCPIALPQ